MPSFISSFRLGLTDDESARMTELEFKMDDDGLSEAEEEEYAELEEKLFMFEDIMLKVEEGEELEPDEQTQLDTALKPIFEKSWHLANYVKSLGPEEPTASGSRRQSATITISRWRIAKYER